MFQRPLSPGFISFRVLVRDIRSWKFLIRFYYSFACCSWLIDDNCNFCSGEDTRRYYCRYVLGIIVRLYASYHSEGNLGWFKSEPLGLFFGLLAVYLLISAIKHTSLKYAIPKAVLGGLLLGLGNASWGGVQYFSIPISLFFIALPFFQKNTRISTYVAIAFTIFSIASAGAFPRPGISFILGLPGIALIGGTVFMIGAEILKRISSERKETRNLLFLLGGFVVVGLGVVIAGAYHPTSFRYLNAIIRFCHLKTPSQPQLLSTLPLP